MANDESTTKTFNAAKLGKFTKNGDYTKQYDNTRKELIKDNTVDGKLKLNPAELDVATRSGMVGKDVDVLSRAPLTYGPDGSDAKGNSGFTVSFRRAGGGDDHVGGYLGLNPKDEVYFKAFLLAFNETFKPDWVNETIYGRADPVGMFKNTTRSISVGLMIPAATVGEGFENLARVQRLVQFLYPTYADEQGARVITQSPLLRLKVMNLATKGSATRVTAEQRNKGHVITTFFNSNQAHDGLLGVMQNLTINHNVENPDFGSFEVQAGTIIPKAIEVQFDFAVIHEHHLGWSADRAKDPGDGNLYGESSEFSSPYFPYDVNVKDAAAAAKKAPALGGEIEQAKEKEKPNDAALQNAQARIPKMGIGTGAPVGDPPMGEPEAPPEAHGTIISHTHGGDDWDEEMDRQQL